MRGESRRVIGQRADLAIFIRQPLRAHTRRNHRDSGRKRLQQFYSDARARQDRADEYGVAHQRLAHIFHEADHLDRLRVAQGMPRRRIGPHDHQPRPGFFFADTRKDLLQEPLQRLHVGQMPEAAQK